MKATAELVAEHGAIKRMLRILGEISDRLDRGEEVSAAELQKIVDFIRVFADSCHHAKEEGLLFVEMEKAGVPAQGGPIEVMNREHGLGRSYVAALAEAVDRYAAGEKSAASVIADSARSYAALLTSHIDKEDNVLYPMADRQLSAEQQRILEEGFEVIERERIGPGKHEEFHRLLEELEQEYVR